MTDLLYNAMKAQGKALAQSVQDTADTLTSTELVAQRDYIPLFNEAVKVKNMLDRDIGFVTKTALNNVCRLLNVYDSDVYTAEPEELPSLWGFKWSDDPTQATDFVAISTSPYMIGNCCLWEGVAQRSTIDNNVHSPEDYPEGWEVAE